MANSTATPPKNSGKRAKNLVQMAPIPGSEQPKPPAPDPETPFDPPPTPPIQGRVNPKPFPVPPKATLKGGYCDEAAGIAYWRGIPAEFKDRLTVYINREGPVLNRLQECTPEDIELMRQHKKRYPIKYIDLPPEPFSEEYQMDFLNRYGSGKYKVFVNDVGVKGSKDADLQSRNLCKFWVKVYDSDFPPILDPSRPDKGLGILDWTHPENQSYVSELRTRGIFPPDEKGEDVAESVTSKLVDKLADLSDRVGVHETDRLVERIVERVGGNSGSRASEMVDTIKAVKELMPQAAAATPAAPTDAVSQGMGIAQAMLQMRAENPMVDMMREELKAMREEIKAERDANRQLQTELRQSQNVQQQAAAPKSVIEQLKELAELKTLAGTVFGIGGDGAAAPLRPGKFGWLDFARETIPEIVNSKILNSLADRISAGPAVQLNPSAAQPANGAAPTVDETMKFVQAVVTPALIEYFQVGEEGSTFAAWIHDGYPKRLAELQAFGEQQIFMLYKQHAPRSDWQVLTARGEPAFAQFVHEFCSWKPESEEDEPQGSAVSADPANVIIDLDQDDKEESGS